MGMVTVIYGAGGHGRDIEAVVEGPTVFVDDNRQLGRFAKLETAVTHHQELADRWGCKLILAVNDPRARKALYDKLPSEWQERVISWDHPSTIATYTTTGIDCHIGARTFLTRCTLGDHVTIGPGATICGDVTIGNEVMIGAGAVVKNLITIGDGATVGCGAVVVKDVAPGETVVGNPARPL